MHTDQLWWNVSILFNLVSVKYMLKHFVTALNKQQKLEVQARVHQFDYSGFDGKLYGNIIRHHCSFVGRDYKA